MNYEDAKTRILAVQKLIEGQSIDIASLHNLKDLLHGINPRIDTLLSTLTKHIATVEKLKNAEVIELSAETLPEETQEQKKRKKAILLLIRTLKDLRGEISRVQKELDTKHHSSHEQISSMGRMVALAKGPLGIVTLVAVAAVIFLAPRGTKPAPAIPKTSYILVRGHKVALDQLHVGTGPDCDAPHYHAKTNGFAMATDGTKLSDPGACGYGRVSEVQVLQE